jgi:hypothetical protein
MGFEKLWITPCIYRAEGIAFRLYPQALAKFEVLWMVSRLKLKFRPQAVDNSVDY